MKNVDDECSEIKTDVFQVMFNIFFLPEIGRKKLRFGQRGSGGPNCKTASEEEVPLDPNCQVARAAQ